jgi:hypothetical protein
VQESGDPASGLAPRPASEGRELLKRCRLRDDEMPGRRVHTGALHGRSGWMPAERSDSAFFGELTLTDELREQLGLADDESLRLLKSGPRTLVLERAGVSSRAALPWDRDLVLSADVQAFALADVLSLLYEARKSGFLVFTRGEHEKCVYLRRGEVVFATSNQDIDRIGECLLRANMITLEHLSEAEKHWSPNERFGKALVERGILTPRELWNGVKFQVEEIVRSLFAYTEGEIHLWEGDVDPDNVVRLALPTQRLIQEGLEQRDELLRFLASLEDERVRLRRCGVGGAELSSTSRSILAALDEHSEFSEVALAAGLDPLTTARAVQLLQMIGAVKVGRCDESELLADAPRRSIEDEGVRELVLDHMKLIFELAAPLVAIDGAEQLRKRIEPLLEEMSESAPLLLRGLECGPQGLPDPEDLVRRALRMPGSREETVRSALGELLSYIEFELKNHPRIQEPDHFLEAVDGLRAKIER